MQPQQIEPLFTRNGAYLCARWGRPLSPIVFGVQDETLSVIKGAFEAVCAMTGHKMAENDPELGANVMIFFIRDWDDLLGVPDLDRLLDGLASMVQRLRSADAKSYRTFRFDASGAIKACFVFLRMDKAMASQPAEDIALAQAVQVMLTWGEGAFADRSPLGRLDDGRVVLRPDIAALIRAAYDPVMPVSATDPSHALRLSARM